jgi:hypothetical protein
MKKLSVVIVAILIAGAAQAQRIERALEYDQHTLADTFMYNKTVRYFQWQKIQKALRQVEQMQDGQTRWGVLQNKSNVNGRPPLTETSHTDEYHRAADSNGVEQNQAIPLYALNDLKVPELYGRDGSPVKIIGRDSLENFVVETINFEGHWAIPERYVKPLAEDVVFTKVVAVDRQMQCIATLEHVDGRWLVRSMNPCSTGAHNPPYQMPTPLGMFVIQMHEPKMFYTGDGNSTIVGYAPWASRFSNGGYLHGVPTNSPHAAAAEFSPTLGTIPRSHMCVRNATSHAKFIYDWAPVLGSLVVVIE